MKKYKTLKEISLDKEAIDREYRDFLFEREIEYPVCGFHISPGWFKLVSDLIHELIATGWDKKLDQVKQKFCGLRFYVGSKLTQGQKDLIDKYEQKSFNICEFCGEYIPGERSFKAGCNTCETCK